MTSRRAAASWCLYDAASSAFPTVALTAFGAPYFVGVLASKGPMAAEALWGITVAAAMLGVTVSAPILGAVADKTGAAKPLLICFTLTCVAATAALGFVGPGRWLSAALLYGIAIFAFEGSYVFYNAFLPALCASSRMGRLSGNAWALGYLGGLAALALCFPWLPQSYSAADAGGAALVYWIVAAWYLILSIPAWIYLPPKLSAREGTGGSFAELLQSIRYIRGSRILLCFLIAYFLYTDGIATVIEFTGVFTERVLKFTPRENVILFLTLNVVAAPGAWWVGRVVDRSGPARAVKATLYVWLMVVAGAVVTPNRAWFWGVALLAATVIGATQAASRVWLAQLAPPGRMAQMMGFLTLSGKASSVAGPLIYGTIVAFATPLTSSSMAHRLALGAVGTLFLVALVVLRGTIVRRASQPNPLA